VTVAEDDVAEKTVTVGNVTLIVLTTPLSVRYTLFEALAETVTVLVPVESKCPAPLGWSYKFTVTVLRPVGAATVPEQVPFEQPISVDGPAARPDGVTITVTDCVPDETYCGVRICVPDSLPIELRGIAIWICSAPLPAVAVAGGAGAVPGKGAEAAVFPVPPAPEQAESTAHITPPSNHRRNGVSGFMIRKLLSAHARLLTHYRKTIQNSSP